MKAVTSPEEANFSTFIHLPVEPRLHVRQASQISQSKLHGWEIRKTSTERVLTKLHAPTLANTIVSYFFNVAFHEFSEI